ncbi:MAG TPA: zinc ribbon domain-containing protein [Acidisarcina sp.]
MRTTSQLRDFESNTSVATEVKLIPAWSVGLAFIAFSAVQYFFWVILPAQRQHSGFNHGGPPIGMRIYLAISAGALAALYALMAGYVSRDAPRRAMSSFLWIIVVLMPGGIGFVLYFLLRMPIVTRCPSCETQVQTEFHFCPQCSYQVSASCGRCFCTVSSTDLFCVHCGHDLATDNMPARLRAFS